MFYPVKTESEKEKDEGSHYIYICTKQPGWKEVYEKNFEKEIIKLILHEKNQALIRDDDDDLDGDDMTPYRVTLDL